MRSLTFIMRRWLILITCWAFSSASAADLNDSKWSRMLERVASGVVTIQVDQVRSFDTETNTSAQATGFVVDAERGLILTNRHVVTPGPVTALAIFQNREEVELYPVYRDPVHDFGIYRYDPAKLHFIDPTELPLAPQAATVGREIRVVGNDAGEQLSILSGTLARLDRQAPEYGPFKYNDFNTFYIQAASGTSGGSSGSPVLDAYGRVVALNAGGSNAAATSFFLPLSRVSRALKLIQDGSPVSRGTLQIVFGYSPYDELKRLGLDSGTEAEVRKQFPRQTGMLVVNEVQPESAASKVLEPGDILLRINGELVTAFEPLEQLLDDSVGANIELVYRRGQQTLTARLPVQSLYDVSPNRYLNFSDGVLHNLSWQMARHYNKPVSGVFVANAGYALATAGVPRGAVITEVNGAAIHTLDDFITSVRDQKDGARLMLRYFTMDEPNGSRVAMLRMDRRWYAISDCHRDDVAGMWPCTTWPDDGVEPPPERASTRYAKGTDPLINKLSPSLVMVNFDMPYSVSGYADRNFYGTGIIIDTARGLVVVDRNTVPVPIGDVRLTFAGSLEIPGRVLYVHPLHNLAVVSYDPQLIGDTPVQAAKFSQTPLRAGETVWAIGLDSNAVAKSQSATVSQIVPAAFPLSRNLRFRDTNVQLVELVNGPDNFDGVLVDKRGDVQATWSSFSVDPGRDAQQVMRGIPADIIRETIKLVQNNAALYSLDAELAFVSLAEARHLGLPEKWVRALTEHSTEQPQALVVTRLVTGSSAASVLRNGDVILAIDGVTVTRFREVEQITQKPEVDVTVLRNGKVDTVNVTTTQLDGHEVERLVFWAGAILQTPYRALAAQRNIPREGVFVAYFSYGSPSARYQLWAGRRIVEVDGEKTPNLDAFIKAVSGREDRSSVRLRVVGLNGASDVITLKLDKRSWPASELTLQSSGWQRTPLP